jgi:hypothetical protein
MAPSQGFTAMNSSPPEGALGSAGMTAYSLMASSSPAAAAADRRSAQAVLLGPEDFLGLA